MDARHPPTLPARTTPTWEVELLISGVAVFAMLQLPGWLDARMFALEPQVGESWRLVLVMAYLYSKSAAIVLGITFALHLLLRAQWIALVGVHSVYPLGVRLERLRMGPIQRAIEEANRDSTEDAIERADNRASVVFALGVSIALIIAVVCVSFCGSLLLVNLLARAIGWQVDPLGMISGVFVIGLLPFAAAGIADHALAGRLPPGGRAHRLLAATLRFYARIGMGRRSNRILALLTSNAGEHRVMALVFGLMMAAIVGVAFAYIAMRTPGALGSYGLFPDSDRLRIDPAHYDDQRDPGSGRAPPFVQSSVVTGPYLNLMVPYRPNRDEPAMQARCAHAASLHGEALAMARLACLQALHMVTLDGKPMPDLHYEITRDPRTDRPALLAMIDVRELAPGRHELRIARAPSSNRKPGRDKPDTGFDTIAFWR